MVRFKSGWGIIAVTFAIALIALPVSAVESNQVENAAPAKPTREQERIPSVTINGVVYSNVLVQTVAGNTVMFSHSRGVSSMNGTRLTTAELRALRLIPEEPPPKPESASNLVPAARARILSTFENAKAEFEKQLEGWTLPSRFGWNAQVVAIGIVATVIGFYLFTCLCYLLICKKAARPSPLLVWIPILQIFALYRAAGMKRFWSGALAFDICLRTAAVALVASGYPVPTGQVGLIITTLFIGLTAVHVIGWIVWCFKICAARNKKPLLGLFVLFPLTNPPALAYLAFSK